MTFGTIQLPGATPELDSPAIELVTDGWTQAQEYAQEAFDGAQAGIQRLTDAAEAVSSLPTISAPIDPVITEVAAFVMPAAPDAPDLVPNFPVAPAEPALTGVAPLNIGTVPSFDAAMPSINLDLAPPQALELTYPSAPPIQDVTIPTAPDAPTLDAVTPLDIEDAPAFTAVAPTLDLNIAPPSALSVNVPTAPALSDIAIPDQPELNLPAVPTLTDLVIPAAPELSLPVFDGVLGDAPVAPVASFSFAEEEYASDLLTNLRARLTEWVDGAATGLDADVEAAIWNRMRDREQTAGAQLAEDAIRQFAVRGFSRPPGAMAIALQKAAQAIADNSVTASREIAIQQAQLEQANRRFAFETAIGVETTLIGYASQIASRALDAAKYVAGLGIEIFRAEVARYQAEIQTFTARAEVYKALLQAELSRLEVFRSQIEAQKLVGEINQQQVALYNARVSAAGQLIELFKAGVGASQAIAEVQRTRIQAFGAEVQAYGEQVRAKASEYDMYATRIRAEVSKAETFKVEADAFNSRVNGFAALMRAKVDQKNSEIDVKQRIPLEMFKARSDAFRNVISGLQAGAEVDRTRVSLYSAETGVLAERVRANAQNVDIYRARLEAERSKADTYRIQSDAYGSQVTAFRTSVDALVAKMNADIKINQEMPLEAYKARATGFDSLVRAEAERLRAQGTIYETQGRVFDSQVRGESARVQADAEVFKSTNDVGIRMAEIELKAAEANVEAARNKLNMLIESVKAGAQLEAQLAASALSGINFSSGASVSYSNSASNSSSNSFAVSYSNQNSESESESTSHIYTHSE